MTASSSATAGTSWSCSYSWRQLSGTAQTCQSDNFGSIQLLEHCENEDNGHSHLIKSAFPSDNGL